MAKKPTSPFGTIDFGKDGNVKPAIEKLPNNQKGQEFAVANRFVEKGADWIPTDVRVELLPERDNDFVVKTPTGELIATVEATEIVLANYCRPLSVEDYDKGRWSSVINRGHGDILAIDQQIQNDTIRARIEQKLQKRYTKPPNGEFWLVIWSVTGHPLGSVWQGGQKITSLAVSTAANWIRSTALENPFDKVFLFEMVVRPELIWAKKAATAGPSLL